MAKNKRLRRDSLSLPSASQKQGHYRSLKINNFRMFDELELQDLGRINLFFGQNNLGKTSILEAIFTHACGLNLGPALAQAVLKRQNGKVSGYLDFGDKIFSLFRKRDRLPFECSLSAKIGISSKEYVLEIRFRPSYQLANLDPVLLGQDFANYSENYKQNSYDQSVYIGEWLARMDGKSQKFAIKYPLPIAGISLQPFKLGRLYDILSHRELEADIQVFSHLKRYGGVQEFTKEMQQIFREIREIDMIPYPDGQSGTIYIEISDNQRIPLYAFGDGMRRWFFLLGNMIVNKYAIHCIEEIDSTFHPGAHALLSKLLVNYAEKFENQLFLTSHSIEFADTFLNALYGEDSLITDKNDDPVRIFTLRNSQDNHIEIWSLSGHEAFEKRQKFGIDLRG